MPDSQIDLGVNELAELELALVDQLSRQGLVIETIKLIGLKGVGHHSTVFTVLINDEHHVLKAYNNDAAYHREIKNLRKLIPLDRLLFAWPATSHQFRYNIVVIQVPEGQEMGYRDLNPKIARSLAHSLIDLHSLRYSRKVSTRSLELRIREKSVSVIAHVRDYYKDMDPDAVQAVIDRAVVYLRKHAPELRVKRSRCHGDLWWSNVIVAEEDVYLIDWEWLESEDYCDDIAQFWLMTDYEQHAEPPTLWADEPPDEQKLEAFMNVILEEYDQVMNEPNMRGRLGLYALLGAMVIFGDSYYHVPKQGAADVRRILERGLKLFDTYCR